MENFLWKKKETVREPLPDGAEGGQAELVEKKSALYRKRPSGRIRSRGGCVY